MAIQSGWHTDRSRVAPNKTSEAVSWLQTDPWALMAAGALVDSVWWHECRGVPVSLDAFVSMRVAHTISHIVAETEGLATIAMSTSAPRRESITVSICHPTWSSHLSTP